MTSDAILTLACPDRPGIVHAVSGFIAGHDGTIVDAQQYASPSGTFFLRIHLAAPADITTLRDGIAQLASSYAMSWSLDETSHRPRVLVLVSKAGHCLNDLLYRFRAGYLPGELVAVAGNHSDLEPLTTSYDVPFHHLPVTDESREQQEQALLDLVARTGAELVVLARYMQVLSPRVCEALAGRIINIHHSFLPSFRGGRPYEQAFAHGVKLIGATAHYVTADLDEGPIIEQEVARVGHSQSAVELAAVGRDLECLALARAVRWHLEHRVLVDGQRTVVFS